MTTETTDPTSIARTVPEDIVTGRNLDLIDEVYAEDCVEHGPFGQEAHGREEIRAELGAFLDAFSDFEAKVEDTRAEGDTVAMRVTLRGTHDGSFMGIEPTNKSFTAQNMAFTRVEDGMIAERWLQPDTLGMLVQLGVIESPLPEPAAPGADD